MEEYDNIGTPSAIVNDNDWSLCCSGAESVESWGLEENFEARNPSYVRKERIAVF